MAEMIGVPELENETSLQEASKGVSLTHSLSDIYLHGHYCKWFFTQGARFQP